MQENNVRDRVERLIYADFLFFNNKGEEVHVADVGEATRADRGALTTELTAIDVDSRWPFAVVVPSKLKTVTRRKHLKTGCCD